MDRVEQQLGVQETMAGTFHEDILPALEGLLFAAGTEGLTDKQVARVFALPENDVQAVCEHLLRRQRMEGRMFEVRRIADAWQLVTHPDLAASLRLLALAPSPGGLSQAALETLAIVAYRQPITRMDIEEVRGVKSDRAIGTLISRGLVQEAGRADGPGRPFLYETTKDFLDHFGLSSPMQLQTLFEQVAHGTTAADKASTGDRKMFHGHPMSSS